MPKKTTARRKAPSKKRKVLKGAAFLKLMAAGKAKKAKAVRGFLIRGSGKLGEGYGKTRGFMSSADKKACKPTLPLKARQNMSYNQLCSAYSRLGDEYRALGNSAFGTPKKAPIRKQYYAVQKQYKEVGVALFKLGRPRSDFGKQHKMSPTEWSRDYDRKRAARGLGGR